MSGRWAAAAGAFGVLLGSVGSVAAESPDAGGTCVPGGLDSWERRLIDDALSSQAVFIDSGDLDGDGRLDLVSGRYWYRNPGRARDSWTRQTVPSPFENMAAVYDFDGDSDLDLLGSQSTGSSFAWARNDGAGSFTALTNIEGGTGDFLQGVAAARFDPGGPLQVALSWHAAGNGVQMLTVADPTWTRRRISDTSQDEQLSAGDIDGDGDVDLLLGTIWLRNDGGSFSEHTLHATSESPDRNRLADIDGDGRLDAVIGYEAISRPGLVAWYGQPATPTDAWTEHTIAMVTGPMSLGVADMDGDRDLDVVVGEHDLSSPASARMVLFENVDGRGEGWTEHLVYTGDEHHDGAHVVDIDGDGDLDIASIGWGHDNVVLYENCAPVCEGAGDRDGGVGTDGGGPGRDGGGVDSGSPGADGGSRPSDASALPPGTDDGCGCRAVATDTHPSAALAFTLLAALLFRRRSAR